MSSIEGFIKKYNLEIDQTKSYGKVVYIRSSIRTEEEAELFVKKFSQKTQTIWTIQYGNYRPKKVVFHKSYVCHRSDRKNRNLLKNVKCGASLDVKVKKVNRSTLKNDEFLRKELPLPCVIRIHYEHNHDYKDDIKYLKVSDEVKDIFYGYFDNGLGVAKAMRLYEENLTNNEGNRRSLRLTPTTRQIYYLYSKWLKKKRIASVVCEDAEDYLSTMDVEELISAIPRVYLPLQCLQKIAPRPITPETSNKSLPVVSNSVQSKPLPVMSNNARSLLLPTVSNSVQSKPLPVVSNSARSLLLPVASNNVQSMPRTQMIPQNMSQLKNLIAHSRMINTNSTLPKIFIVKGSIQNQHISVNSPNHLNGSVLTVVNSRSGVPLIPSLLNNQSSAVMPQISSVMSLEANAGSPVPISLIKNNSEPPTVSSSMSHQMSLESSGDSFVSTILPDYPKLFSEIKVENLSESSEQNMPVLTPNIECFTSSASNLVDENLSSKTNKSVTLNQFCPPILNYQGVSSVSCTSSSYVTKSSSYSYSQSPITTTAFLEQDIRNSCIDTQITNTVHQSGAQVSVKSPVKSTPITIVSAVHLSEPQSKNQLSVCESIKIKEEPYDDYEDNALETETSSNLSTVENVTSLNSTSSLHETVAVPQIKVEANENGPIVINSFSLSEDFLPSVFQNTASVIQDEDHQFLMSLLPEFRRIPKDAKVNLKSQIQSLILSTRLNTSRKRPPDIPKTNPINKKIYCESNKRPQEINTMNKIYHDCRTFPSFPTLK